LTKLFKLAKIKKIDYVLITHFHADHVGGVPQLVQKVTVEHFVDHGVNREESKATKTSTTSIKKRWKAMTTCAEARRQAAH